MMAKPLQIYNRTEDDLQPFNRPNLRPKSQGHCLHCKSVTLSPMHIFCCTACEAIHKMHRTPLPLSEWGSYQNSLKKFSYLDQNQFKSQYVFNKHQMIFYVEGMTCSSCVHLLERLPDFNKDILEARIQFSDSTLTVRLSSEGSWAAVAATIEEWGYKPLPLNPEQSPQTLYENENRQLLKRVAVAGACAGNMMLFVIPVYAGLEGSWRLVFNWVSFLLFIPILVYSAKPFYQGAWNFLKYRAVNIDLPIVVALLTGFALSTYNLIQGSGEIYFDSTASFLFLILASRYLQKRFQQKYLGLSTYPQVISPDVAIGEILEVHQGQQVPVDGRLLSPIAEIDLSMFSGESLPKTYHQNMKILAGTVLLSPNVLLEVEAVGAATQWGQLLRTLRTEAVKKSSFISLTDRLAQVLIVGVFSIALIYFFWNIEANAPMALQRSLALIVIACPCALAFGTPLAYGFALKRAREMGIIVKNADVFERVLKIENIFLDKTGTLTEGQLALLETEGSPLTVQEKQIILSMESQSQHPVAFGLRKAWAGIPLGVAPDSVHEILGKGVEGFFGNDMYSLKASTDNAQQDQIAVEFRKNHQLVHRLLFRDPPRSDSAKVISTLLPAYHIRMLTGDNRTQASAVAKLCGIPLSNCHSELSPHDKLRFIKNKKHSCMIGDGANDALALQSADIGIAVKGSTGLSLSSADVYFTRGGLAPLLDLISISKKAQATVRRNLILSFIYNFSGGILALLGFINPMMAAILMPISSVLILISSMKGNR